MNLTIAYITSRKKPKIEWFFDSLENQAGYDFREITVLIIDGNYPNFAFGMKHYNGRLTWLHPKPTIWQGEHRITKEDWWAKSNAMNTAICFCTTDFIAFVDDRCVLGDMWLQCVKEAMENQYAVCGRYEKRANMKVENGVIVDEGELLGMDQRADVPHSVPTHDWYGGSYALPLEWCLSVNGFSEDMCDGLGSEDSMFGITLRNSGFPMRYDARMKIIEDRTPGESYEGALKRADKNSHLGQKAKSWDIVRCFRDKTTSQNSFDIRDMRARKLNGEDWRPPSASHYDWYDGAYIGDME